MKIAVTGANGFLGSAVIDYLAMNTHHDAIAISRSEKSDFPSNVTSIVIEDIVTEAGLGSKLQELDVVIHTAARVHVMKDIAADPLSEFRQVNVAGTLNLARQVAEIGAKRFIFISSIKVNGEQTTLNQPKTADDCPDPDDPYGISKWEAEKGLMEIANETGMDVVIIRPPLIYGPGVRGNFASLAKLVSKGFPLPFGAVNNKRSLVALGNLVDLIVVCIDHRAASNRVFLVSDGEDLSTTQLLQSIANILGKKVLLLPVHAYILKLTASLLGKQALADRLLGSLQIDILKTREILGWSPPLSVDEGLAICFDKGECT